MEIDNEEIKKALKIKNAVQHYLDMTKEVNIRSTDVFPYLVRKGIFGADKHNGLYFRRFLKRLYKANMLKSLIPQCTYLPGINGEIFGEWYFNVHRPKAVEEKKENDLENCRILNVDDALSYKDAKENLWQLIQGINPLSGEKLNEIEDSSLILISNSLKIFMEADIGSEKEKTKDDTEEIFEKGTKTPSNPESKETSRSEPSHENYIEKIRMTYPKAYYPWNNEEELFLIRLYKENHNMGEIAEKLKRQPGSIKARLKKIGLLD